MQAAKNWVIRGAIRAALVVADVVPKRALIGAGSLLGRVARAILPAARRTARARTALCLPPREAHRVARTVFARAGENLARCLLLRRKGVRALDLVHVDPEVRRTLAGTLAEGRGAIFVSAHLGPFEAIAAAVAELGFRPVVVVRESYDPGLDSVVDAHRVARGVGVIHRGAPDAAFSILRALRAGKLVGVLPDLGGRVPSLELPILGDALAFPIGPGLIAARTRTPVLVGTLAPRATGGAPYELVVERLTDGGDAVTLTHRVAKSLEAAVLRAPAEWLWMAPPIRRLPTENGGH